MLKTICFSCSKSGIKHSYCFQTSSHDSTVWRKLNSTHLNPAGILTGWVTFHCKKYPHNVVVIATVQETAVTLPVQHRKESWWKIRDCLFATERIFFLGWDHRCLHALWVHSHQDSLGTIDWAENPAPLFGLVRFQSLLYSSGTNWMDDVMQLQLLVWWGIARNDQ